MPSHLVLPIRHRCVPTDPSSRALKKRSWRDRLVSGLSWFFAIELFLFAPFKFVPRSVFGDHSYWVRFEHWGYPGWFAYVIGAAELFSGVMLIRPRRRFLGAATMLFVLTGAVATHVI